MPVAVVACRTLRGASWFSGVRTIRAEVHALDIGDRQSVLAQSAWTRGGIHDRTGHARTTHPEDFKSLVSDVAMGNVGAIFSLEASRLARSNQDWHRLLALCAITNTLVIDEDDRRLDLLEEQVGGLKGFSKEIDELRNRVKEIERHLGIINKKIAA